MESDRKVLPTTWHDLKKKEYGFFLILNVLLKHIKGI